MSKVILQNSGIDKMKFHQSLDMRNTISARGEGEVNTEFVQEHVTPPRSTAPLPSPSQLRNSHNSPLPADYAALLNNGTLPKLPFRSSAMNYRLNNYQDNNNNNSTKFESTTTSNNNITKFTTPNGRSETTHNELRIIIIDENWSQYCYRIKVNTPFGKLINRFCQQVKKIDNKSVLFWYQGKNVEDEDTPRTLQVKDGEVIFAHYIKS